MARKPLIKEKQKMKIKKGDTVRVLAGKDSGKESEVITVISKKAKVVVRDVNIVKKATKPDPKKNPQGGIIPMPAPIDVSNVMLVCKRCGKPTRVAYLTDKEGKRSRKCRKCGELIDA